MRWTRRPSLPTAALALLVIAGAASAEPGREAWDARAEGASDEWAAAEPIARSIQAYRSSLEAAPDSLELSWRLMRSLHFAGTFTELETAERREHFDEGVRVGEAALETLAGRLDGTRLDELDDLDPVATRKALEAAGLDPRAVARVYFWTAIHWGSGSGSMGLVEIVRQGVANRLHRYARVGLALEPEYEEGGLYRLLGRLHAQLPRVPFVSGWVDRDRALPLLREGLRIGPDHPGNALLLGITILELDPDRAQAGRELIERAARTPIRPSTRVEDRAIRRQAQARLTAGD